MGSYYSFALAALIPAASLLASSSNIKPIQKRQFDSYKEFRAFFLSKVKDAKNEVRVVSENCDDKGWLRHLKRAKKRSLNVAVLRNTPCAYLSKHKVDVHPRPAMKVFSAPLVVQVDDELFYASHDIGTPHPGKQLVAVKAPTKLWASYKEQFALAVGSARAAPPVYRSGAYQAGTPAKGKKMPIPPNQETVTRSSPRKAYNYNHVKSMRSAPAGVSKSLPKLPVYKRLGRRR